MVDPTGHSFIAIAVGFLLIRLGGLIVNEIDSDDKTFSDVDTAKKNHPPVSTKNNNSSKGFFGSGHEDKASIDIPGEKQTYFSGIEKRTGQRTSWTYNKTGDTTRPFSVYSSTTNMNPAKAKGGIKFNNITNNGSTVTIETFDFHLSGSDIGVTSSTVTDGPNGSVYQNYYASLNLGESKITLGQEIGGSSREDPNVNVGDYNEIDISIVHIFAAYLCPELYTEIIPGLVKQPA